MGLSLMEHRGQHFCVGPKGLSLFCMTMTLSPSTSLRHPFPFHSTTITPPQGETLPSHCSHYNLISWSPTYTMLVSIDPHHWVQPPSLPLCPHNSLITIPISLCSLRLQALSHTLAVDKSGRLSVGTIDEKNKMRPSGFPKWKSSCPFSAPWLIWGWIIYLRWLNAQEGMLPCEPNVSQFINHVSQFTSSKTFTKITHP